MNSERIKTISNNVEQSLVPYQDSYKFAKEIVHRYDSELREQLRPGAVDEGVSTFNHEAITYFLSRVPKTVLAKFEGHGITKARGGEFDRLAAFINILENDSVKGYCGPLYHPGAGNAVIEAYTKAPFLLLSHFDKPLTSQPRRFNDIGWVANIGAYVVNNDYYPIVDELRKKYPHRNIIKANELPKFIANESGEFIF